MIRLFRHYFRSETLLKILFDTGLLVLVMVAADIVQARDTVPIAATQGLSLAASIFVINSTSGLYRASYDLTLARSCARAALALLLALPLAYLLLRVLPADSDHDSLSHIAGMVGMVAVIAHRAYANHSSTAQRRQSRILVFGSGPAAALVGRALVSAHGPAEVVGYFPGPNEGPREVPPHMMLTEYGSLRQCATKLHVDEIVVALSERRGGSMPLRELLDCKISGIRVTDLSTHFEKMCGQIRIDQVNAGWLIFGDGFNNRLFHVIVKKIFDVVCSLILLVLAAPLLLVTALLIRIESKGPIFYRQERVGQEGKIFQVLKFRSMRVDAEQDGKPRWASAEDDRTTRVGRVIRRFRIDEFPQLLNVLKGEMSLVGPRPERPFFVEQLTREVPYYAVRHSLKPGISGWAQVRYQYGATLSDSIEKLQYDLYYVKNHSLFLDFVVLFETIGVVVSGRGAR